MSENPFSSSPSDWIAFQRKYWDAWNQLSRQALGPMASTSGPANVWADALDHWWKTVSTGTSPEVEDFYAKLIEQGKAFFRVSEGFANTFQSAATRGESLMDWEQQMNAAFAGMKEAFSGSSSEAQDMMRQVMAFWELPLDTWQRTVSSMSVLPGDVLQNFKAEGLERLGQTFDDRVDRFLSTPGVGYTREWQGQLQIQSRLWLDYQKAHQHYAAAFAKIGLQCVEHLEKRLRTLVKEGNEITSARELYDLWVDCCEEGYADYVSTDEYAELHANLVNSLMALKRHSSAMIDELLGAMNMPTRREVNTLHRRLQEARRESKTLHTEFQALKEQVERISGDRAVAAESASQPVAVQRPTKAQPVATRRGRSTPAAKKPKATARQSSGQQTAKGE